MDCVRPQAEQASEQEVNLVSSGRVEYMLNKDNRSRRAMKSGGCGSGLRVVLKRGGTCRSARFAG